MRISLKAQAVTACVLSVLVASAIPAVEYYYVYQHNHLGLGPQAWTHWAVVLVVGTLGIVAHLCFASFPLALHAAAGAMLGAALGAYDTALFFGLELRCSLQPAAYAACAACPCAQAGACAASDLAGDPLCASCPAYASDVCTPVGLRYNRYLLAFTGLTAVVALAGPVMYSLVALCRREGARCASAARLATLRFAVEQQAALVGAGERPTVTPSSLAQWVAALQAAEGEPEAWAAAERCVRALAERGYTLALPEAPPPGGPRKGKAASGQEESEGPPLSGRGQGEGAAQRQGSRVVGGGGGGGGAPPADASFSAAEQGGAGLPAGGKRPKRQQVAAEEQLGLDKW